MPDAARFLEEDDADDRRIESVTGRSIVVRLYGVLRAIRIYDAGNQAIRDHLHELLGLIQEVMDDEVLLVAMGQCFYVNGARVRADHAHVGLFGTLTAEFERRRLAGIRFFEGLSADELGLFIRLLSEHADAERGPKLAEAAAAAGVTHVAPVPIEALDSAALGLDQEVDEGKDKKARARQMYRQAFQGARAAILRTARTGRPAIRRAKRVVQPIVDSVMKNEFSVVGLTAIKNHDEYTYAHSVNVGILSIAIAHTLGLPRSELASIGLAGLLHDVGKLTIPIEVLAKPGRLTDDDWTLMRRHPLEGIKILGRMPGLSTLLLDALDVSLYHHRRLDGSGYPAVTEGRRPPPIARIVTLADCYDAMTMHRSYRTRPFTGYEALHTLLGPDRRFYDPAVLWALVQTVGLYPAGTLLETASGHTVLSLNNNREDLRRPECRVLARPGGHLSLEAHPEVWAPMPRHESVARVLAPEEFEVEIDRLLAA